MKNHLQRNLGFLLIGIGALLLAIGLYGLTQLDEFQARARIIVPDDISPYLVYLHPSGPEAIKSDTLLSNVVWELKLDSDQTSPKDATQDIKMTKAIVALQKCLDFHPVSNTRLFDVTVTEKTPQRAAACVNAIVAAYKVWVFNSRLSDEQSRFLELKNGLKSQEQKVSQIETELDRLKEVFKLPSSEPPKEELETSFPAYYEVKKRLNHEKDIMGLLTRKIASEEAELQSLRSSPQIEIVETAIPPTAPVRRKNLLGIVLLFAGLGGCLWGLSVARDAKLFAAPA